jgi:hypothetical protein
MIALGHGSSAYEVCPDVTIGRYLRDTVVHAVPARIVAIGYNARARGNGSFALGNQVACVKPMRVKCGPQLNIHMMGVEPTEIRRLVPAIEAVLADNYWRDNLPAHHYDRMQTWLTKFIEYPTCIEYHTHTPSP